MQLWGRRRVDGVGRPKFDFHTGDERASHETIGDAWPLVAVDRVHRGGKWARDRQTFNKNKKHLTDHDAAIRHDGSLDRLSACVNATAASPLGDVRGIKRPIAPDAAPITLPDCGVCRDLPLRDLQRLQREQAAEARDRVCARSDPASGLKTLDKARSLS